MALGSALAIMLAACGGAGEDSFTPSDRGDKDSKAESDGEPRGAAAAAAMLEKTRDQADERKAAASDEKDIRAFIDSLFAPYAEDQPLDPFGNPRPIFEPQLAAALDTIGAREEETGEIFWGADPICDCQDFGDFSHTITSIAIASDRATVKLSVSNFGETAARTIILAKTPAGWRVHDLGNDFRAEALKAAKGA
jgi:hypothetical protein